MSTPRNTPTDLPDLLINDEELGITHRDYERARARRDVRQGIEDYFLRKEAEEIEDWFGGLD